MVDINFPLCLTPVQRFQLQHINADTPRLNKCWHCTFLQTTDMLHIDVSKPKICFISASYHACRNVQRLVINIVKQLVRFRPQNDLVRVRKKINIEILYTQKWVHGS